MRSCRTRSEGAEGAAAAVNHPQALLSALSRTRTLDAMSTSFLRRRDDDNRAAGAANSIRRTKQASVGLAASAAASSSSSEAIEEGQGHASLALECSSTRTSSAASFASLVDNDDATRPAATCSSTYAANPTSVMKSMSKMGRRARSKAAAAATPGRRLFSSLGLTSSSGGTDDAAAARDADYRGEDAPFSPHLFVGVDDDWHDRAAAAAVGGGDGRWSGDLDAWTRSNDDNANADVAGGTGSTRATCTPDNITRSNAADAAASPSLSSSLPFTIRNAPGSMSRSLAVGSVHVTPSNGAGRAPSQCQDAQEKSTTTATKRSIVRSIRSASRVAVPSTGLSRYFTPQEYKYTHDDNDESTGIGPISTSVGFGGNLALAIEAEASATAPANVEVDTANDERHSPSSATITGPTPSRNKSARSLRWRRAKSGSRTGQTPSPRSLSYHEDDDGQSVSTVVSARSIGSGSYDVVVTTPGRAAKGETDSDNGRSAPQHGAINAMADKNNNDKDDEDKKDGEGSSTARVVSVREVHVTPTSSPLGNIITLTGRTVPMSNVKARPPRIEEEKEEEWNEEASNGKSEGLGVPHIAAHDGNNNDDGGQSISSSVQSPPQLTRSILRSTPNSAILAEDAASSPDSTLGSDFPLSVGASSTATGTLSSSSSPPPTKILEQSVTYSPSVMLPSTPPPVYSPLVSPTVAANLAYAKSVARLQINSQMDDLRSGKRRVTRPLRQELLEDDFDEYFDSICPPSLYVRVDSRRDMPNDDDGLTWTTNLSNVRIDLADYKDAPPSPLCGEEGGEATTKKSSSRKWSPKLSPSSENRRKVMQAKADMKRKREYVKAKFKLREDMAVAQLVGAHGFSTGLAKSIYRSTIHKLPLRVWIVDNSASMGTGDGRLFVDGSKTTSQYHGSHSKKSGQVSQMINSSRWEELRCCVLFHAEMAASIGAPTIFRLLNDPNVIIREELRSSGGDLSQIEPLPQVIGVCARKNKGVPSSGRLRNVLRMSHDIPTAGSRDGKSEGEVAAKQQWEGLWHLDTSAADDTDLKWKERAEKDLDLVENVLSQCVPSYTTPLSGHMWALYDQVSALCSSLLPGQRVAIIIASDGVPSNPQSFLDAMEALQTLPVYLIVRLCTNDEASMHFWNTLDLDLGIPVEILDDFEEENRIAYAMNPWCNYCVGVQRAREWGFRSILFEKLRERPLTHSELHDYCALIFGVKKDALADPKDQWEDFYYDIEALNARERRQYNPLTKRNRGWIDLKQMGKIYGGKGEVSRRKKVLEARKENEKMRSERQRIHELRKKAKIKADKQKKTLGRASLLNRQHDPQSIGLGEC